MTERQSHSARTLPGPDATSPCVDSLTDGFPIIPESELELIHSASLRVLSETGVCVGDDELRRLLDAAGARVEGETVRLPPELVEDSLAQAPRDLRFYDRLGGSFSANPGSRLLGCIGDGLNVLDFAAGAVRPPTFDDVAAFARLADALPEIRVTRGIPMVPPSPEGLAGQLLATEVLLLNTTKHCFVSPLSVELAEAWVDLAEIVNRGVPLAERPIFSALITPMSPLQIGAEDGEKLKLMARKRVPIMVCSCPMAGATSPFTLAGTLAQQNAENLFALTAAQAVQPGAPVFFGPVPSNLDMPTAALTYASPEFMLLHLANLALAQRYSLPSYHPMAHTDAIELDYQAGAERGISLFVLWNIGAPIIGGAGSYHKTSIVSPEQLVLDVELYRMVAHFFKGFAVDEDSLALDEIDRVGALGNFLMEDRTLRYFRSGLHFLSGVLNRKMRAPATKTALQLANERVEETLRDHAPAIPDDVADDIRLCIRDRARVLGLDLEV